VGKAATAVWATLGLTLFNGCNCGGKPGPGNDAGPTDPVINSFTATPASLSDAGGSVTLAWDVSDATQLSIDQGVGSVSPLTTGSKTEQVTSSTKWTLTATNANGSATASATACVAGGGVTLAVTGPSSYACTDNYSAAFAITNHSCAAVTVQSLGITAVVTSGGCAPPSPGTYTPSVTTIPIGATVTVDTVTSGPFCCGSPGCTSQFTCAEVYTYTAATSAGTLTTTGNVQINLAPCSPVCH